MKRKPWLHVQPYFSTGDIARLTDVSVAVVIKWIDAGLLPAHRLPGPGGGGHRRVARADLLAFLKRHGMPCPEWLED